LKGCPMQGDSYPSSSCLACLAPVCQMPLWQLKADEPGMGAHVSHPKLCGRLRLGGLNFQAGPSKKGLQKRISMEKAGHSGHACLPSEGGEYKTGG
jgi:hypothetical protein